MPVVTQPEPPPFGHVGRQVGKIISELQKGYYNFVPGETWTPPVNLYETEHAYLVCVDLAGVDKQKIEITVQDQRLRIRGHRSVPAHPGAGEPDLTHRRVRVHLMEIDHGSFGREVELPHDVRREAITARHENGMLWIELPKL
jgi:HSP20 family protein